MGLETGCFFSAFKGYNSEDRPTDLVRKIVNRLGGSQFS